jgi:DNA-binding MarR family transcriptional regulator
VSGQWDLFEPPAHRRSAPPPFARPHIDTSVAAAKAMQPALGRLQQRIVDLIARRGGEGATYAEICDALDLTTPTVTGRLRELVVDNRIVDSGKRRAMPSGRKGRVYVLAPVKR